MTARTKRTAKKIKQDFLLYLSENGNVTRSCARAGVGRTAIYEWKQEDKEFEEAWNMALELGTNGLEDEAIRRASEGTDKPVFYEGSECGTIREYSDTLLIFLLKARRPHIYRDRVSLEHSGPDGKAIEHVALTPEQAFERHKKTILEAAEEQGFITRKTIEDQSNNGGNTPHVNGKSKTNGAGDNHN